MKLKQHPDRSMANGASLAELVPTRGDQPWSLWALGLARTINTALNKSAVFEDAVARVAELVRPLAPSAVSGASLEGERLAAAIGEALGIPMRAPGHNQGRRLVVIDSVINTGVQLAQAREDADRDGAREVIAVALVAQRDVVESWARHGWALLAVEVA
jgi:hypothetical protein